MSLLLIAQKVWRYKLATLPVLAVVLIAAFYVIAVKPPVYEATSTYILVNPPAPPSDTAIARNPKLGDIVADNPYTRYADQSVVVQVLSDRLNSEAARRDLATRGADENYTVAPTAEFGYTAPILQITGTGSSPAAAVRTANLVGLGVTRELAQMQKAQRVNPKYRIVTQQVVAPHGAQLKASGKLRVLIAVLVLGAVMLFVAVSIADAVTALRTERGTHLSAGEFGERRLPIDLSRAEPEFAASSSEGRFPPDRPPAPEVGRGVRPRSAARR